MTEAVVEHLHDEFVPGCFRCDLSRAEVTVPVDVDPMLFCCPVCWTPTVPYRGHRSLCLSCTEDEVGETYEAIRERATALTMGANKWKQWSTPSRRGG